MADDTQLITLTRNDLASFLPNERAIRAFEQLLKRAQQLTPGDIVTIFDALDNVENVSANASAQAIQALDAIASLAKIISSLQNDNLSPPIQIGTMGEQQAEKVKITGGTVNADLANNQAARILRSSVTLTDGSAAAVGTLTNAPATGNPTKWIAIDDNGTTRFIPTW